MTTSPKVFISHASEDKDRFVIEFAKKLRSHGIDAWIDRWEMLPGDSLVDKIFEEGIKNAQAVIVVLSAMSVSKKWVKEELNAGMVKRINDSSKLIPVIIDECEIPECLNSTVWERVKDLGSYESELDRIVKSIYGQYDKPPLGETPVYATSSFDLIADLTRIDTIVLKAACELALASDQPFLNIQPMLDSLMPQGISPADMDESLEILDSRGYIKATKAMGTGVIAFFINSFGFEEYFKAYLPDYGKVVDGVASAIINEGKGDTSSISAHVGQPRLIVNNILDSFEMRGLIHLAKAMGGHYFVTSSTVEFKRLMR